ncbi:hypothetical protein [Mesorhizobium sangaii]|uniref:Uncharacterized protein n=1 Tax=Mesorhizobium sangaii TaxID=505389 RepID=A0A841NZ66_9HYPH|nr:hypothetical protein [Mesorhizobium sangaii]MBB6408246.1 hypothetical protein [Mesorhizobium sangaii]
MQDWPRGARIGNEFSMGAPKPGNSCSQGKRARKAGENIAWLNPQIAT